MYVLRYRERCRKGLGLLRQRCCLRVGGEARLGDAIAYPSQTGIVRKAFFPDNIWMDFLLTDGWVCGSDRQVAGTALSI